MPFANINHAQVYYEVAGSGKPLVFVHSGIADSRMWDAQFVFFSKNYRVLRYDLRGFGQTQLTGENYASVEDLRALLDDVEIADAYFVGCSLGGSIAMDFTLSYPDRVKALVMVGSGPSGFLPTVEMSAIRLQILETYQKASAGNLSAEEIDRAADLGMQLWVIGPGRTIDQIDRHIYDYTRATYKRLLENLEEINKKNVPVEFLAAPRLGEIRIPTLILIGGLDDSIMLNAADIMAEQIPNAQKVIIEGAVHTPSMEKPDEFNTALKQFFDSVKDTR